LIVLSALLALLIFFSCGAGAVESGYDPDYMAVDKNNYKDSAIITLFDKLDLSVHEMEVPIRVLTRYKSLNIALVACWSDGDTDNKALVKISELNPEGSEKVVFYGWIFSNAPSLSGLEHPEYYVQLSRCYDRGW
jgi:hypothetical protein